MEYENLIKDMSREIIVKRTELENKEKELYSEYKQIECNLNNVRYQLKKLQRECKHEYAVIKHGWQGGGIYYCKCTCLECGRSGDRYIPQYHMHMHNEWNNGNLQYQITLEEAIKIGEKIRDNSFDSDYWWGDVIDYDKLIKDTSQGWV